MFKKAVFPGKYIQGVGAIGELPALIDLLGKQGLDIGVALGERQGVSRMRCRLERSGHPHRSVPRRVLRG